MSQIDAALAVLAKAGDPMNCKAIVEAMAKQGLWTSPGGRGDARRHALRIDPPRTQEGQSDRFANVELGQFTLGGK